LILPYNVILSVCGEPAYEIQDSTEDEVGVQIGQVPWMVSLGSNEDSGVNFSNNLKAAFLYKKIAAPYLATLSLYLHFFQQNNILLAFFVYLLLLKIYKSKMQVKKLRKTLM